MSAYTDANGNTEPAILLPHLIFHDLQLWHPYRQCPKKQKKKTEEKEGGKASPRCSGLMKFQMHNETRIKFDTPTYYLRGRVQG
jgi:hypothetical protein